MFTEAIEAGKLSIDSLAFEQAKGERNLFIADAARGVINLPDRSNTPSDVLELVDGQFKGTAYYYIRTPSGLELGAISWDTPKGEPLSPFQYRKPDPNGHIVFSEEYWETHPDTGEPKLREGNYPLGIIHGDPLRMSGHLLSRGEALECAVQAANGKWETRYYPRENLPEQTWDEAVELLGPYLQMELERISQLRGLRVCSILHALSEFLDRDEKVGRNMLEKATLLLRRSGINACKLTISDGSDSEGDEPHFLLTGTAGTEDVETPITRTAGIPYTQSIVGSKEAPDPGQILVKLSMPSNVPIEKVEDMAMALVHQYMQQMSDLYQEFIVEYDPGGVRLMEEPKI